MITKFLFYRNTGRMTNLVWLLILWWIVYHFSVWNYACWHNVLPRGSFQYYFSQNCGLAVWLLLLVEFSRNFPAKLLPVRLMAGIAALVLLVAAMPTF